MKQLVYSFLLWLMACPALCQDTTTSSYYKVGSLKLQVVSQCFQPCADKISFLNVHENESTSVKAAEDFLQSFGGTLTRLKHNGERLIAFKLADQSYNFDPNRIFTPKGLKATVKGSRNLAAAGNTVKGLSRHLLEKYVDGKSLVVALHNNTDNNYSIKTYLPGGDEAGNAAEVYISKDMDPDDFFVTTERDVFKKIKERNMNVVLQDNRRAKDDGSLSVYAAKKNIPYINVEAQEGHRKEQLQMMEAITDILAAYK